MKYTVAKRYCFNKVSLIIFDYFFYFRLDEKYQFLYNFIFSLPFQKMLGNPQNKPAFLTEKAYEPVYRYLLRRFPHVDSKSSTVSLLNIRCGILMLSLHFLFIWKMLTKTDSKPAFLSDKSLDSVFKYLHKKFPNIDNHAGAVSGLLPARACPTVLFIAHSLLYRSKFGTVKDTSSFIQTLTDSFTLIKTTIYKNKKHPKQNQFPCFILIELMLLITFWNVIETL